jgi:hypothetical protein
MGVPGIAVEESAVFMLLTISNTRAIENVAQLLSDDAIAALVIVFTWVGWNSL